MKLLSTCHPFHDLELIQNRLSDAFFRSSESNSESKDPLWEPIADTIEDEKAYHVALELPGLKREDIDVSVDGDWLQISGERKFPEKDSERKFRRVERFYGKFSRRFQIPKDADRSDVAAEFRDGLLQISISKKEEAQPRLIDIQVK